MKLARVNTLFICLFLLTACSASLQDYEGSTPEFDLKTYFTGEVTAWGIVQDHSNKLSRRFCVDIIGTWNGNQGQLHETFYYNDGEQQIRIWTLNQLADGSVTGSASDVIGQASGGSEGSAFNWQYTLVIPVNDSEYEFAIDDWMFQLDDMRVMNRSYIKKFGLTVAEISIFFDKTQAIRKC